VKGNVVGIPDLVIETVGDLDLETVILVVIVVNLVVGRVDIVRATVCVLNTLRDLVMETVLEVVNERLGVIVFVFKGLFVLLANLVVGIGEAVKLILVVGDRDIDTVTVGVVTVVIDKNGEYDANKVGV
jgi:hypothetical protein